MATLYSFVFLFSLFRIVASGTIVKTLPGYPGPLPFTLETGYVSVRSGKVQLFYYFIESENKPNQDPLVLWLAGGLRCSGLFPLLYEAGPLSFDIAASKKGLPSLTLNPHSWTKFASVIFIDAPVGSGFSYATAQEDWPSSDSTTLKDNYEFIKKWLCNHPKYLRNPFYIAGETYSGTAVPLLANAIIQGKKCGSSCGTCVNLKGYVLGDPLADMHSITNSRVPYAHRMGLVSDEYYQAAYTSCGGEYVNVDPSNVKCTKALEKIKQCTANVNTYHILEPKCPPDSPKPDGINWDQDFSMNILLPSQSHDDEHCRVTNYYLSQAWTNDPDVQKALRVIPGTIKEWKRCNRSSGFTVDITNATEYHRLFTKEQLRAFIYSGDHDMSVPHISTMEWIKDLKLNLADNWRPWLVDNQVGGFTEIYNNRKYTLTFATVKGGGHPPAEYRPKECSAAAKKWFSHQPL